MDYLDYEGAIEELKQIETYEEYDNWYYLYQEIVGEEQIPESEWTKDAMIAEHLRWLEIQLENLLEENMYGE